MEDLSMIIREKFTIFFTNTFRVAKRGVQVTNQFLLNTKISKK